MMPAEEIVERFHTAIGTKDFAAARGLVHDNLRFEGPLERFHKADDYIAALQKLSGIVKGIEVKRKFADGNDVCVLYDLVTNTPAGTSFVSEWFHVDHGKISSVRVVFDARPFAAMFGGTK